MGKKYYCDYCDKSFPDSVQGIRKHNSGHLHVRLKKLHFDAFKDARTKLDEENAKEPCRRFLRNGHCQFGDECRYSHLTGQERSQLEYAAHVDANKVTLPSQLLAGSKAIDVEIFQREIEDVAVIKRAVTETR